MILSVFDQINTTKHFLADLFHHPVSLSIQIVNLIFVVENLKHVLNDLSLHDSFAFDQMLELCFVVLKFVY